MATAAWSGTGSTTVVKLLIRNLCTAVAAFGGRGRGQRPAPFLRFLRLEAIGRLQSLHAATKDIAVDATSLRCIGPSALPFALCSALGLRKCPQCNSGHCECHRTSRSYRVPSVSHQPKIE